MRRSREPARSTFKGCWLRRSSCRRSRGGGTKMTRGWPECSVISWYVRPSHLKAHHPPLNFEDVSNWSREVPQLLNLLTPLFGSSPSLFSCCRTLLKSHRLRRRRSSPGRWISGCSSPGGVLQTSAMMMMMMIVSVLQVLESSAP